MRPRYTKQPRNSFVCGPVAIMNAAKWAGGHHSYSESINTFKERVNYRPREGTPHWGVTVGIMYTPELKYEQRIEEPTLKELDQALTRSRAFLISFVHETERHLSFCVGKTPKYFKMVNFYDHRYAEHRVSRKTLSKYLRMRDDNGDAATIWIVSKN